jgi:hypothetical protein
MLQHVSQQRCYSLPRCGTVAAGAAALLQQALRHCCIRQHYGAALARVAAALWRCCSPHNDGKQRTMQRWPVALVFAATAGRATEQRWQVASTEIFVFFFFFTRQFQRENEEQDLEKRDRASKPVFRLCWLASSFLSTPSFNVNSL